MCPPGGRGAKNSHVGQNKMKGRNREGKAKKIISFLFLKKTIYQGGMVRPYYIGPKRLTYTFTASDNSQRTSAGAGAAVRF